jgi:hypothetical protein
LTAILREAWNASQQAEDRREKIQALSLAKDCYSMKMDLLTNATVVDYAIRFVSEKSEDKDREQVKSSHSSSDSSGNEYEKESMELDYNEGDEKSDKQGEEKQEHDTGEITMTSTTNQVF